MLQEEELYIPYQFQEAKSTGWPDEVDELASSMIFLSSSDRGNSNTNNIDMNHVSTEAGNSNFDDDEHEDDGTFGSTQNTQNSGCSNNGTQLFIKDNVRSYVFAYDEHVQPTNAENCNKATSNLSLLRKKSSRTTRRLFFSPPSASQQPFEDSDEEDAELKFLNKKRNKLPEPPNPNSTTRTNQIEFIMDDNSEDDEEEELILPPEMLEDNKKDLQEMHLRQTSPPHIHLQQQPHFSLQQTPPHLHLQQQPHFSLQACPPQIHLQQQPPRLQTTSPPHIHLRQTSPPHIHLQQQPHFSLQQTCPPHIHLQQQPPRLQTTSPPHIHLQQSPSQNIHLQQSHMRSQQISPQPLQEIHLQQQPKMYPRQSELSKSWEEKRQFLKRSHTSGEAESARDVYNNNSNNNNLIPIDPFEPKKKNKRPNTPVPGSQPQWSSGSKRRKNREGVLRPIPLKFRDVSSHGKNSYLDNRDCLHKRNLSAPKPKTVKFEVDERVYGPPPIFTGSNIYFSHDEDSSES